MFTPLSSRRRHLASLGMGGLGFLLPGLRPGRALAATGPRRLIFIPTFHGTNYELWKPRGSKDDWQFSDAFAALAPFRDKANLLSGLDFRCAAVQEEKKIATIAAGHPKGQRYMLTNEVLDDKGLPQGPSIDQVVGKVINEPQVKTAVRTVVLGDRWHGHSYSGPRQGAPQFTEAGLAYKSLFGGFSYTTGGGSAPSTPQQADHRGDILDFVSREYRDAAKRLDRGNRLRLEEHADTLSGLKAVLSLKPSEGAGPSASCEKPASTISGANQETFFDLAALVVACDISRVVTVTLEESSSGTGFGGGDWHQYLHDNGNKAVSADHPVYKRLQNQTKAVAGFLARLDRIQEGDRTALDNSAVVWIAENANPSHALGNHKVMVFGSMGGAFPTGRYLDFSGADYGKSSWGANSMVPHGNLLVSLAQAMGVKINHFGHDGASTGPLQGF